MSTPRAIRRARARALSYLDWRDPDAPEWEELEETHDPDYFDEPEGYCFDDAAVAARAEDDFIATRDATASW